MQVVLIGVRGYHIRIREICLHKLNLASETYQHFD